MKKILLSLRHAWLWVGVLFLVAVLGAFDRAAAAPAHQWLHSYNQTFTDNSSDADVYFNFTHDDTEGKLRIRHSATGDVTDDGIWSEVTVTGLTTDEVKGNFDINYWNDQGTGYVALAYECQNYHICTQIGTIVDDSGSPAISWSAAKVALTGSDIDKDVYWGPTVTRDVNNNIYVAATHVTGKPYLFNQPAESTFHQQTKVTKATVSSGTVGDFEATTALGKKTSFLGEHFLSVMNEKLFLIANSDNGFVIAYECDLTAEWSSCWTESQVGTDEFTAVGTDFPRARTYDVAIYQGVVYLSTSGVNFGGSQSENQIVYYDEQLGWRPTQYPGGYIVYTMEVFDDGQGPQLYVAGVGSALHSVVRFDGTTWESCNTGIAMASGFNYYDLTVVNGKLYLVGGVETGTKTGAVYEFNSTTQTWLKLGESFDGLVRTVTVHDGVMYAGGDFTNVGGVVAARVAKFVSGNWVAAGDGLNNSVYSLVAHKGNLYAGGMFTASSTAVQMRYVAQLKTDGTAWQAVASTNYPPIAVGKLQVIKDQIFMIGRATSSYSPGGAVAYLHDNGDSTFTWTSLTTANFNSNVDGLAYDDVQGQLYIAGDFEMTTDGGLIAPHVARYDFTSQEWSGLGSSTEQKLTTMIVFNDKLYVAATARADSIATRGVGIWDGQKWQTTASALTNGSVKEFAVHDGRLYAAGSFGGLVAPDGTTLSVSGIVRLNAAGTDWEPLEGTRMSGLVTIETLASYQGELYAGGTMASYKNLAKYNATTKAWEQVGTGLNGVIYDLEVIDNKLYLVGEFTADGSGASLSRIATYEGSGTDFMTVGGGLEKNIGSIAAYNNKLYAAIRSSSSEMLYVYDGTSWTTDPSVGGQVTKLRVLDGELHAAGWAASGKIQKLTSEGWVGIGANSFKSNGFSDIASFQGDLYGVGSIFSKVNENGFNFYRSVRAFLPDSHAQYTKMATYQFQETIYVLYVDNNTNIVYRTLSNGVLSDAVSLYSRVGQRTPIDQLSMYAVEGNKLYARFTQNGEEKSKLMADITPLKVEVTGVSDDWVVIAPTPSLKVTSGQSVTSVRYVYAEDGANPFVSLESCKAAGESTSAIANLPAGPENGAVLYVCAVDASNYYQVWSGKYNWDTTAPTVISDNGNDPDLELTEGSKTKVTITDSGSGLVRATYLWDSDDFGVACANGQVLAEGENELVLELGKSKLSVCAIDALDNEGVMEFTYRVVEGGVDPGPDPDPGPGPNPNPDPNPDPELTPTPRPKPERNESTKDSQAEGCAQPAPGKVRNLRGRVTASDKVELTWDDADGTKTDWMVTYGYAGEGETFGTKVSGGDQRKTEIGDLLPSMSYSFRIEAVNGCAAGSKSDPVTLSMSGAGSRSSTLSGAGNENDSSVSAQLKTGGNGTGGYPVGQSEKDSLTEKIVNEEEINVSATPQPKSFADESSVTEVNEQVIRETWWQKLVKFVKNLFT